jgi:hypothetical protein
LKVPRRIKNDHRSPINSIDGGSGQFSASARKDSISGSLATGDWFNNAVPLPRRFLHSALKIDS